MPGFRDAWATREMTGMTANLRSIFLNLLFFFFKLSLSSVNKYLSLGDGRSDLKNTKPFSFQHKNKLIGLNYYFHVFYVQQIIIQIPYVYHYVGARKRMKGHFNISAVSVSLNLCFYFYIRIQIEMSTSTGIEWYLQIYFQEK